MRSRLPLRAVLPLAAVLGALLSVLPLSASGAAVNPWSLCLYRGSHRPEYVAMHEDWLGTKIPTVLEFIPYDSWYPIESPTNGIAQWEGSGYEVVWTVPMLPRDGSTLQAGARGAYDAKWRSFARTMVNNGLGNARIRLGHEFNHTHYPWTAADGREADFAAYYRRIVTVTRSISGADFRFTWNVLSNGQRADVEKAYPGDAYVDVIGLDLYDGVYGVTDFEARWTRLRTQKYGLDWLKSFAAKHGKPMAFDEWALIKSTDPEGRDPATNSGDNTVYINRMIDFFESERVAYACYFDVDTAYGSTNSRIMNGPYPNASDSYRARLGRGTPTTTTRPAATSTSTTSPSTISTTMISTTTTTSLAADVAMIVGDAAKIPPKDVATRDRLVALRKSVRLVDDDTLSPDDLSGASIVIVSSSVVPTKIPEWLASHPGPLLGTEAYVQTTLGLADRGQERPDLASLRIVEPSHPLAAGLTGDVAVQSGAPLGVAVPAAAATIVARASTGEAAVYALETGAALANGTRSPARRVGFFFSYDSPPALAPAGWLLFDAAIAWLD